jgi:putative redox protein
MSLVKVKWIDGLRFVATASEGHSLVMDSSKQAGGEGAGFRPIELLLVALGGCTGIDVVSILKKQRQKVEGLEMVISGERVENPPRVYGRIQIEYIVYGKDISEKAVKRAIELSEKKYCSVGAMLGAKAELTTSYRIEQK